MYIVRAHYWNALLCVGKCNKECNRSVSLTYKLGSIKQIFSLFNLNFPTRTNIN